MFLIGAPLILMNFIKVDKVNKLLYEKYNEIWVKYGSFAGMFTKVESSLSQDPMSMMKLNMGIITGQISKEIDDKTIKNEIKKIRVFTLLWNTIGIPIVALFIYLLITNMK